MADKKRTLAKGLYNWTFLGIVLAVVIVVNVICSFAYWRFDVTDDQRFSLADSTVEFLEDADKFKGRVSIKIYLAGNLPAEIEHFRVAIEDKLKEFKVYAGDRIEYSFHDPTVGSEEDKRAMNEKLMAGGAGVLPMDVFYVKDGTRSLIRLYPGAVIDYGGAGAGRKSVAVQFLPGTSKQQTIPLDGIDRIIQNSINNLEYMLVSGLRRAVQEKPPHIGFLQGHGEESFAETRRVRALLKPYYAIDDVNLNDSIGALDNIDGLIIARPTNKFSSKDLYLIDQFVMRGGRLMCFVDQLNLPQDSLAKYGQTATNRIETGLENLLFDYGLTLEDHYVMDGNCLPKPVRMQGVSMIPWFFHVLATPTDHPISRNLDPVALEYVSEVKVIKDPNKQYTVTPILTSSTNSAITSQVPQVSFMMPIKQGNEPLTPDPQNVNNKMCLAALSEGRFTSYFKNRIVDEFANNPDSKFLKKSTKEGKVLLVGNGRFASNRYDSIPSRQGKIGVYEYMPKLDYNDLKQNAALMRAGFDHVYGNQEFIQNLTDFMLGDHSVLDVRSREIGIHAMDSKKVREDSTFYKLLNVGLPILLILGLAFVMNFLRKTKYAS